MYYNENNLTWLDATMGTEKVYENKCKEFECPFMISQIIIRFKQQVIEFRKARQ